MAVILEVDSDDNEDDDGGGGRGFDFRRWTYPRSGPRSIVDCRNPQLTPRNAAHGSRHVSVVETHSSRCGRQRPVLATCRRSKPAAHAAECSTLHGARHVPAVLHATDASRKATQHRTEYLCILWVAQAFHGAQERFYCCNALSNEAVPTSKCRQGSLVSETVIVSKEG